MRTNQAKAKLAAGELSLGTWLSLASPMAARFLARTALDWLTVDLEHSPADWETMGTILGHVADVGMAPLVRVPAARHDYIKRALDSGAYGIVAPMVMDRREAEAVVWACKYPPNGNRSVGGALHALNFGATPEQYYARANAEILTVIQCEHIAAVERADEIFSVPGIDAVFVGPNDLRASMRSVDGKDPSADAFEAALDRIFRSCEKNFVAAGIHCFSAEEILMRKAQGWRFLALGSDLSLMLGGLKAELGKLDRGGDNLAKY